MNRQAILSLVALPVIFGSLYMLTRQREAEREVAEQCLATLEKSNEQTRKALDATDRCTDTYMQCTKTLRACVATNEACFEFFTQPLPKDMTK